MPALLPKLAELLWMILKVLAVPVQAQMTSAEICASDDKPGRLRF